MKGAVVITTILCSTLLIGGRQYSNIFAQSEVVNQTKNEIVEQYNTVQEVNYIAVEDALNILQKQNTLDYLYQGDESTFKALKEKGLSGYVFIPDIDTDIGYFVDKNTAEIYYFHPGGYLELVK
ncbi:MAG: hypothetical protein IJ086_07235 [Clostridium sp.]|nr:hypothetical protein [Clostridium sp.]